MPIDPKYMKQAQVLYQQALYDAMAEGHMDWMRDPRLRTPEQLAEEDVRKQEAEKRGLTLTAYDEAVRKQEKEVRRLRKQITKQARKQVSK